MLSGFVTENHAESLEKRTERNEPLKIEMYHLNKAIKPKNISKRKFDESYIWKKTKSFLSNSINSFCFIYYYCQIKHKLSFFLYSGTFR